jgi:hypothetical protein
MPKNGANLGDNADSSAIVAAVREDEETSVVSKRYRRQSAGPSYRDARSWVVAGVELDCRGWELLTLEATEFRTGVDNSWRMSPPELLELRGFVAGSMPQF